MYLRANAVQMVPLLGKSDLRPLPLPRDSIREIASIVSQNSWDPIHDLMPSANKSGRSYQHGIVILTFNR